MEQNNQIKHKNKGLIFIAVVLLTITIISSSIGLWAWAKYTSAHNSNATAQVAKWSFDLRLKEGKQNAAETSGPIDLASTQFNHVANDRIAPGTSGLFYVIVDTTGTEVDVLYNVNISLTNCPRNIKFYRGTNANDGEELSLGGVDSTSRSFSFSRYLHANGNNGNENDKNEEPIYWVWDYSGSVSNSTETYDQWDTADSNLGTTTMTITATGTEMLEEQNNGGQSSENPSTGEQNTGNQLSIGDSVAYTTTLNGQTLDDWKVFYVDGDYTYLIYGYYLPTSAITNDLRTNYNLRTDGDYWIYTDTRSDFLNAMTTTANWSSLLTGTLNENVIDYSDPTNIDSNIYAMGSPTIELWVNSWNTKYPNNTIQIEYWTPEEYGECVDGWAIFGEYPGPEGDDYGFYTCLESYGEFDGLYFLTPVENDDVCGYRLASASAFGNDDSNDSTIEVNTCGEIGNGNYNFDGTYETIRPIISLPTSIVNQ